MHADRNLGKLNVNSIINGRVCSKIGGDVLDHGTLKSGVYHKWFYELNSLIGWFLHGDSDWVIFGLTTNLLCFFDISWMPAAVVLIKNALLLVPTGNVLGLGFPKCFSENLD